MATQRCPRSLMVDLALHFKCWHKTFFNNLFSTKRSHLKTTIIFPSTINEVIMIRMVSSSGPSSKLRNGSGGGCKVSSCVLPTLQHIPFHLRALKKLHFWFIVPMLFL
ncbi:unnamed protein product [Macrosiphum euphorbiae]|uniref:Uncharacterized protein n=1 Tax=Macrosiphum euphorbiae TaxID=13131 RepID=A0AAV0WB26_9HEMI|nr:unnamed protein product [Macrosiphum euphorbiae]